MEVKRGPIILRCDATYEQGFESFYRCLSLASSLQRRRRGTVFFSYLDPLSLGQSITRANNDWVPAEQPLGSPGDFEALRKMIFKYNPATVVLAGNNLREEYVRQIKALGVLVIVIDSLARELLPADVLVNPYLAPGYKAFPLQKGTQRLMGKKFALVRALFRRQRTIRATEQPGPFRCLICFGDDDAGDQTWQRLPQILEMPKIDKVSVVCRTHHPRYRELKDWAETESRLEVVTENKELMTRLVRSHFALSSGDTWTMELCCVGIPQLMISSSQEHALNARKLDDEGVATFLGESTHVTFEDLHEAVSILLEDPQERLGMNRCSRNLIDGRGGDRIVNGMEIILHSPGRVSAEVLPKAA